MSARYNPGKRERAARKRHGRIILLTSGGRPLKLGRGHSLRLIAQSLIVADDEKPEGGGVMSLPANPPSCNIGCYFNFCGECVAYECY